MAPPTDDISIEFEIQWNFAMLLFVAYSVDHNEVLHRSRQCYCHDVCKVFLWSVNHILSQNTLNFDRISNSMEMPLMDMRLIHVIRPALGIGMC